MTTPADLIAALEKTCATSILRGDDAACEAVAADDYTLLEVVEGRPLQIVLRKTWLERIGAARLRGVTVDDIAVSVYGDVAVAVMLVTEASDNANTQVAVTDVWRREGDWRLVQRHLSRPAAPTP